MKKAKPSLWSETRRGGSRGSGTSRGLDRVAPHQGFEVLDALEIVELSTEQLLDAMQESPRRRKRKSSRTIPSGSGPTLLSRDSSGSRGRAHMSSGLTAPRPSGPRLAMTPVQAALAKAVSESGDPTLARELGSFARELSDGRMRAQLKLPPVGLRAPWRPVPRERPTTAEAQAHVATATWRRPAAILTQSQSAPAISSSSPPRDAEGAGGAKAGGRGPGWAKASWQRAAGLTREQAADRASMLRHRVAEAASEVAARQERKRAAVRAQLERLRVSTPQYAAGRDLPRMDLPLDDGWPGEDQLPQAEPAVPNWGAPPTLPPASTSMYPPPRGPPARTLPVLVTTKPPTAAQRLVRTDSAHVAVQPEVRVHLRVHPHFVAHVPAHRCRSMVAVDGDRETLRTDLQRIKMPTASEASASVHMLAGGAARIISNDRRSRVRCA